MNRVSLSEFVQFVEFAEKKYPNAKLISVGHGYSGDEWYYSLLLDVDGKEIRYEIPMYKEVN